MNFVIKINKEFDEATKKDINYFLGIPKPNGGPLKQTTHESCKTYLISFYKWLGREEAIKHLKINQLDDNFDYRQIWTPDEVKQLIKKCDSSRDRAMIAIQ